MTKRMTLLARRSDLSTADFRAYWAGPHARLALGMDGIGSYVQNRVDKLLWCSQPQPRFDVDGIVELTFRDSEAMRLAQGSPVGRRLIPADEPHFLRGWTLCVMEPVTSPARISQHDEAKVMVPFHLGARTRADWEAVSTALGSRNSVPHELNWTQSTASRPALWSEPAPPDGIAVYWFASVAHAHMAFDNGKQWLPEGSPAAAYLVDELRIR